MRTRRNSTAAMKTKGQYPSDRETLQDSVELIFGSDPEKMKEMAKKDHSMAHSHSNSVLLEPNKIGEIIWKFNTDTKLEVACNVPGHYQVGMVADIKTN